jgi:hypothetical protein
MTLREILPWVTTFVVAILGAVMAPVMKSRWQQDKERELKVGPQPFEVRMKEEFVTRREFERLEQSLAANVAEIKGVMAVSSAEMKSLFRETMSALATQNTTLSSKIERQNKSLSEEIGKVASAAHGGRQKIWEVVNDQREEVAALRVHSDVAAQLSKLAEAIHPKPDNPEPKKA